MPRPSETDMTKARERARFEKVFQRAIRSRHIHEAALLVEDGAGAFSVDCGYGGKDVQSPFVMASVAKLLVTACVLILLEQGRLKLDAPLSGFLDDSAIDDLHTFGGRDYSRVLTVEHLLFQTADCRIISPAETAWGRSPFSGITRFPLRKC